MGGNMSTEANTDQASNWRRDLGAPDKLETRLGTMEFVDGAPTPETVSNAYDQLDLLHAVNAFMNGYQAASTYALRQGFLGAGVPDNAILLFSELMGSESLFLTANADTVYFVGFVDLSSGPVVVETPPEALGIFDDMAFNWMVDFGFPGPDRGEGGRFLLLPPGYEGDVPDSGFHIGRSRTDQALLLGRAFMQDSDPKPTADLIRRTLKLYPYVQGGYGTSIATLLEGDVRPGKAADVPETTFVEGTGKSFNTIPFTDARFFDQVNELVQGQPLGFLDPEIMGQFEAIGIVKGEKFEPDGRMRAILAEAAAIGTALSRTVLFDSKGLEFYPGSAWTAMLFVGGYDFETPPPMVTAEGIVPFPATGSRKLHSRTTFFYGYTGITPAMCMRLTGVGSQYLVAFKDAQGAYLEGDAHYTVSLPQEIPEARFWSLTLYDNQTRSMLQTPQRFPRAGSQSFPTPAAETNEDGSTTVHFAASKPDGVSDGNWIQTAHGRGFFAILRLYSPLEGFFDKSWQIGEVERVDA
jgi:hypothetical protein